MFLPNIFPTAVSRVRTHGQQFCKLPLLSVGKVTPWPICKLTLAAMQSKFESLILKSVCTAPETKVVLLHFNGSLNRSAILA